MQPRSRSSAQSEPASSQHYFSSDPRARSHPLTVRLELGDVSLDLETDSGVFAHGQVDRGTELLLRTIPEPPRSGDLLDLGCGYGAVALTLALRAPGARVWAIDVNRRALELCGRTAQRVGARNVHVCGPPEVPAETRFAAVYSNPPVRVGKELLHRMLTEWLARLLPGAHAYLVMQRNLGADSLARWLQAQGHEVDRLRSRMGYRVLDVRAPAGTPHD